VPDAIRRERVSAQVSRTTMNDLIRTFGARGDLAHLALFLWAASTSTLLVFVLREWIRATRRFDAFVRELARFNRQIRGRT
jgi:hypothetical protein